jgi:hypothetical protein
MIDFIPALHDRNAALSASRFSQLARVPLPTVQGEHLEVVAPSRPSSAQGICQAGHMAACAPDIFSLTLPDTGYGLAFERVLPGSEKPNGSARAGHVRRHHTASDTQISLAA